MNLAKDSSTVTSTWVCNWVLIKLSMSPN
ncbi:hypothetical protein CY0110_17447 [Crocosphaera chwakensis CCY0110]|uniref:Uncharacterized protein n=1 Tax=Crocosphaera chwakensis CCY0110 TaxID=391612 RepID=A3IIH1_9CHRO|nr:hypothetical protein CY0110_17447 [Crocosphaera chwakensis CCY0110]